LEETNKQVVGFSEQLRNLQDVLKNPKQRGVVGEYFLETALRNVLPPGSWQMQYSFKDRETVDAVVFVEKRLIPIDSKFSLENYNRMLETRDEAARKRYQNSFISDLKSRIDETSKYVRPEERTMDFAFMYIPSEAVYTDLVENKVGEIREDTSNLITYAFGKKVTIVSPTTFMAYLVTILQGLRNQKISEQAHAIINEVERLGKHLFAYSEYMKRLGSHLQTTVSAYNKARGEFVKVDKDVVKITGGKPKIKVEEVEERPLLDD
jgi:DNA recombination protein RmuC